MKEIMNFVNECNENLEKLGAFVILFVFGFICVVAFAEFGWVSAVLGLISYLLILHGIGKLYDNKQEK